MTKPFRTEVIVFCPIEIPPNLRSIRAVIDWFTFRVFLKKASNGGALKRFLESFGVSRVIPQNKGAGGAATEFLIQIQNPETYSSVEKILTALEERYGLCEKNCFSILEIEVSIDFIPWFYAAGSSITMYLMKRILPPVINNPRFFSKDKRTTILLPDRHAYIDSESTLYIGNKNDDLLWRVYWKQTDETYLGDDGVRYPERLFPEECRARVEVRIKNKELSLLGITTVQDLASFKFEKLHSRGYYKFAKRSKEPLFTGCKFGMVAFKAMGVSDDSLACVIGLFGKRDKKRYRPLKMSRYLETDMYLTEEVRSALRGLTRRFSK